MGSLIPLFFWILPVTIPRADTFDAGAHLTYVPGYASGQPKETRGPAGTAEIVQDRPIQGGGRCVRRQMCTSATPRTSYARWQQY